MKETDMAELVERSGPEIQAGEELSALRELVEKGMAPSSAHFVLMGYAPSSPVRLAGAVGEGLPYEALERLRDATGLSWRQMARLLHTSTRTLERRRQSGSLEAGESDRAATTSRVFAAALALFEYDKEAASRWLSAPRRALGDATPWEMARTETGAREVEALIGRLEHGVFT